MTLKTVLSGFLFYKVIVFLILAAFQLTHAFESIDTGKSLIQFDPYVSILDKADRSRYDVYDLQILVAKVATRFSRFYIELTDVDLLQPDKSITQAPIAVAKYNCLASTPKKIELWLGFERKNKSSDQLSKSVKQLRNIINATNYECNGTISTLLISEPVDRLRRYFEQFLTPKEPCEYFTNITEFTKNLHLKFGLLENFPTVCNTYFLTTYRPSIALIKGFKILDMQRPPDFRYFIDECRAKLNSLKLNISLGIIQRIPDTYNNFTNTSYFRSSWEVLIHSSKQLGHELVISNAFDTPYKTFVNQKTTGWWRLVENPSYNCTSDYIFDEKVVVASDIDWEEDLMNFEWLKNPISFETKSTGLIFRSHEKLNVEAANLKDFEKVVSDTSRVYIMSNDPLKYSPEFLAQPELLFIFSKSSVNGNNKNYNLLNEFIDNIEKGSIPKVDSSFTSNLKTYKSEGSNVSFVNLMYIISYDSKDASKVRNVKISYSFKISMCGLYSRQNMNMPQDLRNILSDENYKTFLFHYNEDSETIKLGATRMAQQRIVLFEQCRQLVWNLGNSKTEISFVMLEFNMDFDFYDSPWKLQNYVKYWKLLNEWVVTQVNTVLFIQAIDRTKSGIDASPTLGWWRYDTSQSSVENLKWPLVDKREDALKLSKLKYLPESDNITITQITVITVLVCILVISLLFLMNRHLKKRKSAQREIDSFLYGDDSANILNQAPYDNVKYEINESRFSLEPDKVLGIGEFGKVVRGKIKTSHGLYINVAVKTINGKRNDVTALGELLSEIKLLAYIGKHPNISKLIGANTKNLKYGKVFAFLEYCHLGSLQKYLREIRNKISDPIVEYHLENAESNEYVNKESTGNNVLDPELSNNFVRWTREICGAMVYLSEKNIVHADLATRNVLLDKDLVAKICDFGLSRRMNNYTIYKKKGHCPMPWKWMAPESLRVNEFCEKSDVWAFGITIWEIYTLGEVPYQGLNWDANFCFMIDRGLRPSKPVFDEKDMYAIMLKCWKINKEDRPSFADLFSHLSVM